MPGQPGTIPERVERPSAGDKGMVVSSDDIKKAKEALKAKGLNPGPIDGTLDSKTQQALRDFQKANKLPVTGVLDAQTAEKLGVTTWRRALFRDAHPAGALYRKIARCPKGKDDKKIKFRDSGH